MISRGRLYLFGGCDGHYELNDLWVWDLPTNEWRTIEFDTTFVFVPKLREHSAVLRGDKYIVHGGYGGVSVSARTFSIDLITKKVSIISHNETKFPSMRLSSQAPFRHFPSRQVECIGWQGGQIRVAKPNSLESMVSTYGH
jgi:hypothetical protein